VKHFFGGDEKEEIAYDDKFVETCEKKIILKKLIKIVELKKSKNQRKKSKKQRKKS